MGRLRKFLILLLCLAATAVPVLAASSATRVQTNATVDTEGVCQISITMALHLDSAPSDLYFAVPAQADNILVNGGLASVKKANSAKQVLLPVAAAGDHTITLQYRIPAVLSMEGSTMVLTLPLLNRFPYPIDTMEFSVTLPGEIEEKPQFISGYHHEETDELLQVTVSGNRISCVTQERLKDHESLTMTLKVDPALFPHSPINQPLFNTWDGGVLILVVLSVVYYCLTLLPRIPPKTRCYCAPDGIAAGEVGTCLTGTGTDLTMMVLTWAQLGYLSIELDNRGKVLLHKRMEMGNERSRFEVGCFQSLFKKRSTVDGSSLHYAQLYRKTATQSLLLRQLFQTNSGNPRIFRGLSCVAGILSGISLAFSITYNESLQILLAILLGAACGGASFLIQSGGKCIPLRDKTPLLAAVGCGILWILGGFLADSAAIAIPMVLYQFLAGFAAAFGGRRSELGLRCISQLTALRRYMCSVTNFELNRLLQVNPNYYYELAPYALAMDVDKAFAKRFGKAPLPPCNFLILHRKEEMTATEWALCLRKIVETLDARQKKLPLERLLKR